MCFHNFGEIFLHDAMRRIDTLSVLSQRPPTPPPPPPRTEEGIWTEYRKPYRNSRNSSVCVCGVCWAQRKRWNKIAGKFASRATESGRRVCCVSSALFKCARQQRRVHRRHILTHIIYIDKKKNNTMMMLRCVCMSKRIMQCI